MSNVLDMLKKNRVPILLAEIGAYLHDLGKARREFIEEYSEENASRQDRYKFYHHFSSIFPEELRTILSEIEVSICNEKVSLMDFIEKHHPEKEINGERKNCEIPPIIRLLHPGWSGYDGMDSGLDKGEAKDKQRKDYTFIATAFGYEYKKIELSKIEDLTKKLQEIVINALRQFKNDNDITKLRKTILDNTKKHYLNFLGETRRSANDVTLWDHSYSVATLVKCAVAKNVIDCQNASFDPLDFNWKVFSVDFDVLGLLAKSVKLGDILGYWKCINEAFDKVKEIIEVEYPVGNEIYRDTTGIFFLIPDINVEELKGLILDELKKIEPELMPHITIKEIKNLDSSYKFDCKNQDDIPKEIRDKRKCIEKHKKERLKESLPETRSAALQEIIFPTSFERFSYDKIDGNWKNKEICPICYLRPMNENSDGCEDCLDRRKRRVEEWKNEPKNIIWLDEVSDQNDRVALIVGCFVLDKWLNGLFIKTLAIKVDKNPEPKNPSPARIRRCWETTEEFIQSTIFKEVLEKWRWGSDIRRQRIQLKIDPNPDIPEGSTCDIDIDGVRFSPVCINEQNVFFISTINLEILKKFGNSIDEISKNLNEKEIKVKTEKDGTWKNEKNGRNFKIIEVGPADEKFRGYSPYVEIYDFPDQFMVLVPDYEALDIAEKILEEYEIQFSKVRDRLPFHLGIIAFHRKTPLYAVMDAGKRLLEAFKKKSKEKVIKANVVSIKDFEDEKLGNGKEIEIKVINDPTFTVPLHWRISYSTGDPEKEDLWYPYIRINSDVFGRSLRHVKEIKENDEIEIEPSYSKLFYIENAADRFRIDEYLKPLDYIHYIQKLWKKLEEKLKSKTWSVSQLYAYWEEVKKRRQIYEENAFKEFVKAALTNILEIKPQGENKELFDLLFQATMDSSLDLCLYWNLQIRKAKILKEGKGYKGGERNE